MAPRWLQGKKFPVSVLASAVAGFLALNGVPFVGDIVKGAVETSLAEPALVVPPATTAGDSAPATEGEESPGIPIASQGSPLPPSGAWSPNVVMKCAVSGAVLLSSLFILLSKMYGPEVYKWAYSSIAVIIGYWL